VLKARSTRCRRRQLTNWDPAGGALPRGPLREDRGMSESVSPWNREIVDEFRSNGGNVGGNFNGAPLLLLHTIGARAGNERVNPLMYQDLGGPVAVFATTGGAPSHPDWYHNLVSHPEISAEIGTETRRFRARTATGAERDRIWMKQKGDYHGFAHYESQTDRVIPVIILEPL
jgi:deazaflavin-dependent oxidoreductase (nitroreductase family)